MSSSNVLNLTAKGTQVVIMAADELVKILEEISKSLDESHMRNEFLKLAKENTNDVRCIYFNPGEYDAVKAGFGRSRDFIPAAFYQDSETNKVICLYMAKDAEKVNEIFDKVRYSERSFYEASEMNNRHIGDRLATIKGLSEVQKNVVASELASAGIDYTFDVTSGSVNGKEYSVTCLCDTQDRADMVREALEKAARESVGVYAKYHAVNVHSPEFISQMINEATNSHEAYIVSASNPTSYVAVSDKGFTYYSNGKEIETVKKENSAFQTRLYSRVQSMPLPVSYPDKSFETKSSQALVKEVSEKINLVPTGKRELTELALEEKARRLVALKMSLDNGGQYKIQSSFYNNDVSFYEFFGIEQINDEFEAKMIEPKPTEEQIAEYKKIAEELDSAPASHQKYAKAYIGEIYARCNEIFKDGNIEIVVPQEKVMDANSLEEYIDEIVSREDEMGDMLDKFDGRDNLE